MTIPYPFQRSGVRQVHRFGCRALLADEMGLGKSLSALLVMQRHPEMRPVVVICPAIVKYHWQREASVHVGMAAEVLDGTKAPKDRPLVRPEFVIINYDILWPWMKFLKWLKPELVIVDESQAIMSLHSKRTKGVLELCNPKKGRKVPYVVALSGTPLTNRPAELWPTLHLLRPDIYKNPYKFYHRHCSPKRMPWGWTFKGATRLKELHTNLLKTCLIRRRKEDVLEQLPPNQKIVQPIEITDRKQYEQAKNDFLKWLVESQGEEKASKAAKAERLVWKGYLLRLIGQLKVKSVLAWIDNFLETSDGKLIVFGIHKENVLHKIKEAYADNSVLITGDVSPPKRQILIDQFTQSKKHRLFIGNIVAGGVGWNGTVATDVAFAEFGWVPGALNQAGDRVSRIGQTKQTRSWYLVANDTLEVDLLALLSEKQKTISTVLDGKGKGDNFSVFDEFCQQLLAKEKRK